MAASETHHTERSTEEPSEHAPGRPLRERLEEEVNRAGRHGTPLCCLVLQIEDLPKLRHTHGDDLAERLLAYVELALRRELRRFDRIGQPSAGELLVMLPGADSPRGEVVARRVLARLRLVKLELAGRRHPLRVAVRLVPWRAGLSAGALLGEARADAFHANGRTPG
jgi:GGDEF domain-containing protein